jgi:hypothetical protein
MDFPIQTSIFLWFSYGFPMVFLWIFQPDTGGYPTHHRTRALPPRRQHVEPATVCHAQLKVLHAKLIGLEPVEALVEPQKSNVFVYIYTV